MGLLDRFRRKPPPVRPVGGSGRAHTHGFLELDEYNPDLQHPASARLFDEMARSDPDVFRAQAMVLNPARGGTWSLQPFGGDDADQKALDQMETVRWALWEFMNPGLPAHIASALGVFTRCGFGPYEEIWQATEYEGRQVLVPRKLDVRLPRTIVRFFQDDIGDLAGIEQHLLGKGLVTIPASQLVYYRIGAEGDNWEGTSLLRPAYKPWYFKDRGEKLDAIGLEREATGLPVVYPPGGGAVLEDGVLDELEAKLGNIRAGEQGYLLMPGPAAEHLGPDQAQNGWHFELVGFGGQNGGRDARPMLDYHRDGISAAVLAEFMRLGQSGVGARATADVQQDPFYAGVEALAGTVEDELNRLIQKIVAINFDDADGAPKLSMEKADSTSLAELGTFAAQLVEKGVLVPDEPLEDFMRERADFPPADPKARAEARERKKLADEQAKTALEEQRAGVDQKAAGTESTRTTTRQSERRLEMEEEDREKGIDRPNTASADLELRFGRPLRSWEQLMALGPIVQEIDEARAQLEAAAGEHVMALARDIAATAAKGNMTRPPKPPGELVDAIAEGLDDLYLFGRQTVRDELQRQGAPLFATAADDEPRSEQATKRALLAAQTIVGRITSWVARLGFDGRRSVATLQAEAEREALAALRDEAQRNASPALNAGRTAEADDQSDLIAGSRYTSVLDTNRCADCKRADDDVLRALSDPVRLAHVPPNPSCQGGDRCRCLEFFQYAGEVQVP